MANCLWWTLILGCSIAGLPTDSWAYCSEPYAPSCATRYGPFEDQDEFDRCRREMVSYQSDVETFSQCQKRIISEAQDQIREAGENLEKAAKESGQAVTAYNEAVETFNRRARGY